MAKEADCIFCGIAEGRVPSYKIYEDDGYLAILDIFPNIRGQTLVMPKRHRESYAFGMEDGELSAFITTVKKVARMLERPLKTSRIHLVLEGTAINHLHAKLYPAIGLNSGFTEIVAKEEAYFKSYPGYVTTLMGPRAKDEELMRLQKEITGK